MSDSAGRTPGPEDKERRRRNKDRADLWRCQLGDTRGRSGVSTLHQEPPFPSSRLLTLNGDIRWGIPVKSIGLLASLSNKQCDGLSAAEVLKRDIQ